MSTKRTIVVKTTDSGLEDSRFEKKAGGTIYPGDICMANASDEVVVHGTSGGEPNQLWIACENPHLGKTIDDAYSSGDMVVLHKIKRGDHLLTRLAASQTIAFNDLLMSNGDGKVTERTLTNHILGTALEALTTGGGETGRLLILAR